MGQVRPYMIMICIIINPSTMFHCCQFSVTFDGLGAQLLAQWMMRCLVRFPIGPIWKITFSKLILV